MSDYQKRKRAERKAKGLCMECGNELPDSRVGKYYCPACAEKHRERLKRYRERRKIYDALIEKLSEDVLGKPDKLLSDNNIPMSHKCASCVWSTYLGDRIFCPFMEGRCMKNNQVFANAVYDGSEYRPKELEIIDCSGGA